MRDNTPANIQLQKDDKIFIAGHSGMVGSALLRILRKKGFNNLILKTHKELDLLDQKKVRNFFAKERPEVVFLAAARVGGIEANRSKPYEFLYENLQIQNNVINSAFKEKTRSLVFLGSSCIFPRICPQPMKEEYLMTGPLEPTNEGYALAKIAGMKLLEFLHREYGFTYLTVMPCNLYGTNDSFDPVNSHVLAGLVRRFSEAVESGDKQITLWGTGNARREFLHVDDMARAVLTLLENNVCCCNVNVGSGSDVSISELAKMIAERSGFQGKILWDHTKPDGMPRKCLDVSKLNELDFKPSYTLEKGIEEMIDYYYSFKGRESKQ